MSDIAFLFLCSFFIIVFFVLLNMIMAVIMGAYDEARTSDLAGKTHLFGNIFIISHFV